MATVSYSETILGIYWDTPFLEPNLKEIFGNKKNYRRYVAEKKLNLWDSWLIWMGYRF